MPDVGIRSSRYYGLHPKGTSSHFVLRAPRRCAPRNDVGYGNSVARQKQHVIPRLALQAVGIRFSYSKES